MQQFTGRSTCNYWIHYTSSPTRDMVLVERSVHTLPSDSSREDASCFYSLLFSVSGFVFLFISLGAFVLCSENRICFSRHFVYYMALMHTFHSDLCIQGESTSCHMTGSWCLCDFIERELECSFFYWWKTLRFIFISHHISDIKTNCINMSVIRCLKCSLVW